MNGYPRIDLTGLNIEVKTLTNRMPANRPDKFDELCCLADGRKCRILATKKVTKILEKLGEKQQGQLSRYFENFCEDGWENFPQEQFKSEGQFPLGVPGKGRVQIYAFKPWKARIYGGIVHHAGKPHFVATEADPSKKTDKADREMLARAAKYLAPFV